MDLSQKDFETIIAETLDRLPEKFSRHLNNVAIFVADQPSPDQLKKMKLRRGDLLFGLFEGHAQARKLNYGPVLPDQITIFRLAILSQADNLDDLKRLIASTLKHEIAHHFGSDERGASRAGRS